jgi:peptidoglycan biosynthesis protein MviN/MurJ (putative lipid II flippase)
LGGGDRAGVLRQLFADLLGSVQAVSGYSLLTGLGLLLGFARELTVASTFGLSSELDVFVAVMSVQLFFGTQIGNALETAFISRVAKQDGAAVVSRSLKPALYGLTLVNAGIVVFLLGSAGLLLQTIFPRFDAGQQALAVHTLHALLVPIVFASTAGLLRGALAVLGSFAPGFLAGSIVSVCTILSIIFLSSSLGIDALTLGVAAGNLCVLVLFAGRLACHRGAGTGDSSTATKSGWFYLWGAAVTVLIGELVYSGVAVTERSLASWLPAGSIAGFFYASTIVSVPLSLLFIPLTTMTFPRMVEAFGCGALTGLELVRKQGMLLLGISVVVVAIVALFAQSIVEVVFMRGQFSIEHARFTASILSVTIFALPFMSLGRLLRNSCYSLADYRTPVVGLGVQWAALAGLGLMLVPRYGAQGLAVAMVAGEAATMLTMSALFASRVRST